MDGKILIVEDEFVVANDLRIILKQAGYRVTGIAASVEEAEENLQKHNPEMVLLDIRLKGDRSGIDFARKLKAENIAFIYISANSTQKVLEEARTTEPYGFLVKPFREKDLLITLDIAWYRHKHSIEAKVRQEELLQRKLSEILNEKGDAKQKYLKIVRVMQSSIPFDLILSGSRPLKTVQFNDTGYLRVGFDEYQFIGEGELLTITGLKKSALSAVMESSFIDTETIIHHTSLTNDSAPDTPLQQLLFDCFGLKSCLVFPVLLRSANPVHYFFFSHHPGTYTKNHISVLNRYKQCLAELAETMSSYEMPSASAVAGTDLSKITRSDSLKNPGFKGIIGTHPLLLAALDLATQVAPYNTSVLILGESGTGKEKVAQLIHSLSPRKDGPFIKVNCPAIPPTLIESELFGHEKGAFTGATEKRKGRFEQAEGGTIFLDEIGELSLDMQVKLLRVLQEKEIESVGGGSPKKINVRIVAATNRHLEKEVAEGNFRLDLYYRLNVFPITLPALRERRSDIEALILFFAHRFCKEFNKPFTGIAPTMLEELCAYSWPGNIRELENVLEQSVILNDGKSGLELKRSLTGITNELTGKMNAGSLDDIKNIQRETEREYIISILKKVNGRIRGANGAAELLNIKPTTLESKMLKLDLKREDFMNPGANL